MFESSPIPPLSFTSPIPPDALLKDPVVRRALRRADIRGDWDNLFGEPLPFDLQRPYTVAEENRERHARIMRKYASRGQNTRRAWNRLQRFMPELLRYGADPQMVFEMSTAHGAVLEVARHFGHRVLGNDFANMVFARMGQDVATTRRLNDPDFTRHRDDWGYDISETPNRQDWPYRHLTTSQDLPMHIFDGGQVPYPLDDKSVDVTLCMQAIEHYCHPEHWMEVVGEFCRISRRSVFVLLNPMHKRFKEVEGYEDAFNDARLNLRDYNENGFDCVSTHMHWGQSLGFKLIARA